MLNDWCSSSPHARLPLLIILSALLGLISLPAAAQEEPVQQDPLRATANLMNQMSELSGKLAALSDQIENLEPAGAGPTAAEPEGDDPTAALPQDDDQEARLPNNFLVWYVTPVLDLLATLAAIVGGYVGFKAWRRQLKSDREESFKKNIGSLVQQHLAQHPLQQ